MLEVSVPTARRDLEALAAAGVPVYAQHLAALEHAVVHRHEVRLSYRDHADVASERVLDPLGLVDKDGVWYLLAGTTAGRRTFRVDRVAAIEAIGAASARPADLDVAAHGRTSRPRSSRAGRASPRR